MKTLGKYPNHISRIVCWIISPPLCILKRKIVISSIQMCYGKCHVANKFSQITTAYVDKYMITILTISGHGNFETFMHLV